MTEESKAGALVLSGMESLPAPKYSEDVIDKFSSSQTFKRLQLFGSNSEVVKEQKFPMGHFGIVDGSDIIDLGESIDVLVLSWRPKAVRIGDAMEILYDPEDEAFKAIEAEVDVEDSGCMCGIEFLVYHPEHGFLPYFLANKSGLYIVKPLRDLRLRVATIKVTYVKGKKFSWHAPKVSRCSTPININVSEEIIKKEMELFNNPDSVMKEFAEGKDEAARPR